MASHNKCLGCGKQISYSKKYCNDCKLNDKKKIWTEKDRKNNFAVAEFLPQNQIDKFFRDVYDSIG